MSTFTLSFLYYQLLRVPISFTSCTNGNVHHHIVLGIEYKRKWGAMGVSRLSKLMDKPLIYSTLNDLIEEFISCYESCFHTVLGIDLGLPFSHSCISETRLQWKLMTLSLEENQKNMGRFPRSILTIFKGLLPYIRLF